MALVLPRASDHIHVVALSLLPAHCRRRVAERLRAGDAPQRVLEGVLRECRQDPPVDSSTLRSRAAAAIERARASGLVLVPWSDARYPAALSAIVDPPPVVWVRGRPEALAGPAVAIVGSRTGSPYGLTVAERLAADLAARGLVVISGLARGVDCAAHRGALAAKGTTVAVLGSGADVIYPAEHRGVAREVERQGAIVSELAPGTPPRKPFFPWRNRIISGLSRAVVIAEAGEKSGSLITARLALDQGREVLAVPGNILSGRNRGGHALLRDGAKIVESADDILEELGMRTAGRPGPTGPQDEVLAAIPAGEACDVDVMCARTGLTSARLLTRLFELELAGLVRRAGGGRFVRV